MMSTTMEKVSPEDMKGELKSNPVLQTAGLTISYGQTVAVNNISISIPERQITAIIGPSGCGKSTLLRSFNRMNDFVPGANIKGQIMYRGIDLYGSNIDPVEVRRKIGMVFQKPNPFPKSIFENVSWGPLINGYQNDINERVEKSLRHAALWDEVKDRLNSSALTLSGGQQQRLCIARALAMEPEIILMDEPCSALDPVSTAHIEDLMFELKQQFTIIIVTHNMQQASRVSKFTAFFDAGELIEFGETQNIFTRPQHKRTEDYVSGRFG